MGFIEELRRKRQREETREAQERAARDAVYERKRQEIAGEKRKRQLRAQALDNSIVPKMTREITEAGGGEIRENSHFDYDREYIPRDIISISFQEGGEIPKGQYYEIRVRRFDIQGQEDGSVVIGRLSLSSLDAQDRIKVERALGNAYKSAKVKTEKRAYPRQEGQGPS